MKKMLTLALSLVAAAGATASAQTITGAGASFPNPLYSKMFAEYKKQTGVSVNYQSVGSGAGQKQIINRTVDFGASDNPMTNDMMKPAPAALLHVPTAIGAVVPAFNVPGVTSMKLTGETLAGIYLGSIKKWNDPKIVALNPGVKLPGLPITPVRRSDSSGTTYVFTDYLSSVNPTFKSRVGRGNSVKWPVGSAAKGNDGVAGAVKSTPGSIGYVELAYAKQNRLPFAQLKNKAGNWITADNGPASAAAAGVVIPSDTRVSIVNSGNAQAWPIASFTYVIFYKEQKYGNRTQAQAKNLKNLLWWMTHDGQKFNEGLDYAKLPAGVMPKVEKVIKSMTYGGQAI
ncbi:phosphate ABC transporter, periplasmic phosphate-binding protein [Deinococcus proteolyticus MRP]|uniref:Phosphate-binding protein n=1 Tax=Deinococcus proteolyticus (strain ATCC 35074 / DSM 20540 / JCM 6276 / NBRC 101906 / NCIMB 13154 / VKM Ac-1939 / CCM 2703 / MRP) TaxID=693977 RepID=F0RKV9_DEIPM|nr:MULTISPECIES: phosphate ABC transporter substrate-binding protein PstS [Deinococcus]ADY26821.1 phosphate ABC transporter, periplasmic phosphate-binding protein [Deinococcus proteolyticus MRP]MCY1702942.1 phosphate ABC transporter substrate-binding protein PstS [Deinococcus sp. SL84]